MVTQATSFKHGARLRFVWPIALAFLAASSATAQDPSPWLAAADPPAFPPVILDKPIRITCSNSAKIILAQNYAPFAAVAEPLRNELKQWKVVSYDLRTGKPVGKGVTLRQSPKYWSGLEKGELSPDGRLLAVIESVEKPLEVCIYSTDSGEQVQKCSVVTGEGAFVQCKFVNADTLLIYYQLADRQNRITFFNATTGEELRTSALERAPEFGDSPIYFSPGFHFAAMGNYRRRGICLWRVEDGKSVGRFDHGEEAWHDGAICFSPDGKQLAAVDPMPAPASDRYQGSFRVVALDMESGRLIFASIYKPELFRTGQQLQWSPDNKWLVWGGQEVLDASSGKPIAILNLTDETEPRPGWRVAGPEHMLHVTGMSKTSPFSVHLQVVRRASVWKPFPDRIITVKSTVGTTSESPRMARELATPAMAKTPVLELPPLDTRDGSDWARRKEPVWKLDADPPTERPRYRTTKWSLRFEGSGELVFPPGVSRFCAVRIQDPGFSRYAVIDLSTGQSIGKPIRLKDDETETHQVLSPDGRYLAAGVRPHSPSQDSPPGTRLGLSSFITGKFLYELPQSRPPGYRTFTFAGQHRFVAFPSEDATQIAVWDARTGKEQSRADFNERFTTVGPCAPSPGGRYLALLADEELDIFDFGGPIAVKRRSLAYLDHEGFLATSRPATSGRGSWRAIAWSPDSTRLAIAKHIPQGGGFLICVNALSGAIVFERFVADAAEWRRHPMSDVGNNPLDWTSDSSRILLLGSRLCEAESGRDILVIPYDPLKRVQPRRIVGAREMVTFQTDNSKSELVLEQFAPK